VHRDKRLQSHGGEHATRGRLALVKFDFAIPFDGQSRGMVRFLAGFGWEF
jgi:hypothetical protein